MSDFLNEKFSSRAKNALKTAQTVSQEFGHPHIGSEHLLYGIVNELSSFASEVLLKNKISADSLRTELKHEHALHGFVALWRAQISQDMRDAMMKAAITASKYQYQFIGTEHFLFGIVDQPENRAKAIMQRLRIDPNEIKKNLLSIFENVSKFPELGTRDHFREIDEGGTGNGSALDYFTSDLTARAKNGGIDPLIGRKQEVERLVSILNRRTKNNPVLIGEPGVGKTAIVEGLALAIAQHQVSESLAGKKILALDLALMVAGSMFRGEFENRIKQVIEEIKNSGDVILFIDELHTVVGAGATTGSLDAANILKPALARGELRAIGATTLGEYKKYIETDPALERRFQPITVSEPTSEETLEILKGLRPFYESHHGVEITDSALEAAVKLTGRYLTDRFFPDKAIDVTDETASYHKIIQDKQTDGLSFSKVEKELEDLTDQKKQAVFAHDFPTAQTLRYKEMKLQTHKNRLLQKKKEVTHYTTKITNSHIAETVARITGIPAQNILKQEAQKVLNLEKKLRSLVIGQDEIIKQITASIRRSRAGVSSPARPLGSFMFLGPTGVGKTITAKYLASELFGHSDALIRIDMSEFMERHNVARLIGAPAGYVGYDEGGRLTEIVKRRPYCVVLFDEIEKAHPEVVDILLQILEEGELTDASGKKINFKNTIIIMTSNIGVSSLNRLAKNFGFAENVKNKTIEQDFHQAKQEILSILRQQLRPEFLNRIDKILVFRPLTKQDLKKIVGLELAKLQSRLQTQKINIKFAAPLINYLTNISLDPREGARLVRKNIQDLIEDQIARHILSGKYDENKILVIKVSSKRQGKEKTIEITET
ncbi:MAG: ATP-dependent Clp protease ATP-binding subunit [bacterium]|nr:ATP-dependent Clp protease ATP-binding subunit [bacterium]